MTVQPILLEKPYRDHDGWVYRKADTRTGEVTFYGPFKTKREAQEDIREGRRMHLKLVQSGTLEEDLRRMPAGRSSAMPVCFGEQAAASPLRAHAPHAGSPSRPRK